MSLCAKVPYLPDLDMIPVACVDSTYYKDVDAILSWPFKVRERLTLMPSVSLFNMFNFVNFGTLSGLTRGDGAINGTVAGVDGAEHDSNRLEGTGVFAVGAPREVELGPRHSISEPRCTIGMHAL